MGRTLYKYLDVTGAKCMVAYSNLQFTNASQLNDPFDCSPSLMDYSDIPDSMTQGWIPKEWLKKKEENDALNLRNATWLCSLSKVNDSMLMWSHYCANHRGICIGLNMDEVKKNYPPMFGTIYLEPLELEVKYQDIAERRPCNQASWYFQWETKDKKWEYEQEVRLLVKEPYAMYAELTMEQADRKGEIDWREVRYYMPLKGECFESIYFGIHVYPELKEKITNYALVKLNPNIKIYQMSIDESALCLKPILEDIQIDKNAHLPMLKPAKKKFVYKTFRM